MTNAYPTIRYIGNNPKTGAAQFEADNWPNGLDPDTHAQVMAAAPELLEALRKIADGEWTGTGARYGAQAAYAKATGAPATL